MNGDEQPGPDEIEQCFTEVLDGRMSREEADRRAWRWVTDDDLVWDDVSWWALGLLHGIGLRNGPDEDFLHDGEQVRQWLEELRRRRM
ncbi:hypothetical protein [Planomonospora venezuelensis]|uniref:Uncharacterized protein n=1 Tax=Planomonospora venezuelensis TaxID=1999 RepID=A0A841D8N1_PLAVE|nr:hypothetical protein [Planomonospora venezuelensis]MBB5963766.1 hypothetical protein [Planomonospora venezuelensis]GIM99552.1 hypothetical protein Pve01_12110 [Planomonospora venezuelensis]